MYYLKEEIKRLEGVEKYYNLNARGKAKLKEFRELMFTLIASGLDVEFEKEISELRKENEALKAELSQYRDLENWILKS